MARSFVSGLFTAVARGAIRAARTAAREAERQGKQQYLAGRAQEAENKTQEVKAQVAELQNMLALALKIDDTSLFASLMVSDEFKEFVLPRHLLSEPTPPNLDSYLADVKEPGFLAKLVPGSRRVYERELEVAHRQFDEASAAHQTQLLERAEKIREIQDQYEREKTAFQDKQRQRNQEVRDFRDSYKAGDPESVVAYTEMVLERSEYPDSFPQEFRIAFVPENKEVVIEYQLPSLDVVPSVSEYRYIKSKDTISEKLRKPNEIKRLYQDLIASVCLRTIQEVFGADQPCYVGVIVFNGFVQGTDPSTGKTIRPHVISVRTTRQKFAEIHLDRVEKAVCLRNLGAQVSRHADELQPVKPIVDFNMVDRRFVEQSDVISDLESRPNLMDLNPYEFENLVANLFNRMGLETKQTRSHRDGGVDAVAFDKRPVLGGKVVIQAKRYKNTVGVAAVRDLYGTMLNEGANKGILVTTSGYGPDAFNFAKDKPIELIDGGGLLYLLQQVGIGARIVFPEDVGS